MLLNPRQLEAFRLVMLRGSVTGAAQSLKVTQPAVSRLIRDLEIRTGIKLFEHRGNHLVPTPEARLLLVEVDRYAHGIRAVSNFAEELRKRRRGMLSVVALPAIAMSYLPRFVASFIAGRSLESVYVHGMPSHLVIEAVASGQAEIGVAADPPERPGLNLELLQSPAVLVVPKGHRLSRRLVAGPKDLGGERIISLVESTIFTTRTETALAGVSAKTVVTTPLSGIACSLVAAGAGIAIVDPFSATEYRGVTALRFDPPIDGRIAIVTSVHRRLSAVSREFIEAFRAHVAATLAEVGRRNRGQLSG